MMTVRQTFDDAATNYDSICSALVPDYEKFFGAALKALPQNRRQPYRILDLGAGTGVLSEQVGNAYPHAHIIVSDFAPSMLEQARSKLGGEKRYEFALIDMLMDPLPSDLDAVVSSMAIHHFDHADKRFVFSKICKALKPGGIFVNADQVSSGEVARDQRRFDRWLDDVRDNGIRRKDLEAVLERMRQYDQNAPEVLQRRWLLEAGFNKANVTYQNYFWAVFRAVK